MAEQSIFQKYISDRLQGVSLGVANKYNGKDAFPTYLFKTLLKKKRSFDGRWTSTSNNINYVMADYVATNSSIPVKSRGSMEVAGGKIHKVATERWLDEDQMQILSNMQGNPNVTPDEIGAVLFQDVQAVIAGANERLENTFLVAASNGTALVSDDNVGKSVRMNYGYKSANQLGVTKLWTDPTSNPLDDIDRAMKKVPNNRFLMLDKTALKGIFSNEAARGYFGFISGFMGQSKDVPNLNDEAVVRVLTDKFKLAGVQIVDRQTIYEIDGVQTTQTPWKDGTIALFPSQNVGVLAWNRLAEANDPVAFVDYSTVDEYLLISMWKEKRSFYSQYTNSQGLVVPVIENGDKVVTLDTKTVQA